MSAIRFSDMFIRRCCRVVREALGIELSPDDMQRYMSDQAVGMADASPDFTAEDIRMIMESTTHDETIVAAFKEYLAIEGEHGKN